MQDLGVHVSCHIERVLLYCEALSTLYWKKRSLGRLSQIAAYKVDRWLEICLGFQNGFDFQVIPHSHLSIYFVSGVSGGRRRHFCFGNWDHTFYNLLQREDFCVFNHCILKQDWSTASISITLCNFHLFYFLKELSRIKFGQLLVLCYQTW